MEHVDVGVALYAGNDTGAGILPEMPGASGIDIVRMIGAIVTTRTEALVFGTDLPSTRTRRFRRGDMDLLAETVGEKHREAVFYRNAASLYRLPEA